MERLENVPALELLPGDVVIGDGVIMATVQSDKRMQCLINGEWIDATSLDGYTIERDPEALKPAARRARFAQLPWVRMLRRVTGVSLRDEDRCEGIKWDKVALKDIFEMKDGVPPRGLQESSRCKRPAEFAYRFTQTTMAQSQPRTWHGHVQRPNLCWQHASRMMYDYEEHRVRAYDQRESRREAQTALTPGDTQ